MRIKNNIFSKASSILFSILFSLFVGGCSSDDEPIVLEEELMEEAIANLEQVRQKVSPLFLETNSASEMEIHLKEIQNMEGVERAWIEENSLSVKIKNGGLVSWLYTFQEQEESVASMQDLKNRLEQKIYASVVGRGGSNVAICENKNICIINQFSNDKSREFYATLYKTFEEYLEKFDYEKVDIINAEKLTLSFISGELPKYGIILWATHGGYLYNSHWLLTGQKYDAEDDQKDWKEGETHVFEIKEKIEKEGNFFETTSAYWAINENYIAAKSENYPNNSIMFCSACESLKANNKLAETFRTKNLGCYIGYNENNFFGKKNGVSFIELMNEYNQTVSEVYQNNKSSYNQEEISANKKQNKKDAPAEIICYPNDCNIALRKDFGEIKECIQTKNPKFAKDSVFFSYNVTASYFNANADVKEWGIALYKGEKVNKIYPVSNVAEITQNVDLSFYLLKEQLILDYNNYVATPKEEWSVGVYEMNDKGVILYSRNKAEMKLIYDQQPSITILDLEIGETVDINPTLIPKTFFQYFFVCFLP